MYFVRQTFQPCCMLFLDLAKAFDSLDRTRLTEAMTALQIELGWICIVEILNARTLYTISAFGKRFSCSTPNGVRQGSREGPLIFLLVFALALRELGAEIRATTGSITAEFNGILYDLLSITFADDTSLILPTCNPADIQQTVAKMSSIFIKFGSNFFDKTFKIHFFKNFSEFFLNTK